MRASLAVLAAFGLRAACAAPSQKDLVFLLLDDWGWANFGAHNPGNSEVVTPNLDALMAGGIELERHYVFKYCSPSRCALQSGRNPIHVNVINNDMREHNVNDPATGVQGIPPNMTTIAAKLRGVGCACTNGPAAPPRAISGPNRGPPRPSETQRPDARGRKVERGNGIQVSDSARARLRQRPHVL